MSVMFIYKRKQYDRYGCRANYISNLDVLIRFGYELSWKLFNHYWSNYWNMFIISIEEKNNCHLNQSVVSLILLLCGVTMVASTGGSGAYLCQGACDQNRCFFIDFGQAVKNRTSKRISCLHCHVAPPSLPPSSTHVTECHG